MTLPTLKAPNHCRLAVGREHGQSRISPTPKSRGQGRSVRLISDVSNVGESDWKCGGCDWYLRVMGQNHKSPASAPAFEAAADAEVGRAI